MYRTQVLLREEQVRMLREEAARRGVSMAEIIREALEEYLARWRKEGIRRRALEVVGRFASGQHDIAEQHDRELEETYADA